MYERKQVSTLPGFENINDTYTIDSYGIVRVNDKVLNPADNGHGYKYIGFYVKAKNRNTKSRYLKAYVHRLVAMAFIDNPDNKPEVDHINRIRDDNRVINLRWVTKIENANNQLTKERMIGINSNGLCYVYDYKAQFIGEFPSLCQANIFTNTAGKINKKVGQYFFLDKNDVRLIPRINKNCKANSIVITHIHTNEKYYFHSNREARRFFSNKINITDAIKSDATIYGLYKVRNLNYKKLIDSLDL